MPNTFRELVVWQKSICLAVHVYDISSNFPSIERFGLTSQCRRAASSIPANIAEGYGRYSRAECRRFLLNARGSLFELETHLVLAERLRYLEPELASDMMTEIWQVGRVLGGYIKFVESKSKK